MRNLPQTTIQNRGNIIRGQVFLQWSMPYSILKIEEGNEEAPTEEELRELENTQLKPVKNTE